jgi:hypothetical protein
MRRFRRRTIHDVSCLGPTLTDRDAPEDREKAGELLTEAVAMYRKIGMPKHVEMAEALLGEV